jgi:uncharacterized membrane protein
MIAILVSWFLAIMFWSLGFWLSCSGLLVIGYHVLASWLLAIMFWSLGYWLSYSGLLVFGKTKRPEYDSQ